MERNNKRFLQEQRIGGIQRTYGNQAYMSEGINLETVLKAFVDPKSGIGIPVKYEMSGRDIAILGETLGLIGISLWRLSRN